MRMPELKSLARDRGLRNYSRMSKAELVAFFASDVLYHILKKIGKKPNADLFQFMKGPNHQRTEEEIKFVFNHLGWDYSPIQLV